MRRTEMLQEIRKMRFEEMYAGWNERRWIMTAFTSPIVVREGAFFVAFSIGTAIYPADGQDIDTLVRHADQSMYAVKIRGRGEAAG